MAFGELLDTRGHGVRQANLDDEQDDRVGGIVVRWIESLDDSLVRHRGGVHGSVTGHCVGALWAWIPTAVVVVTRTQQLLGPFVQASAERQLSFSLALRAGGMREDGG